MRLWMVAPLGLALLTACGQTDEQRAATGGLGGAAAGAVVGGPVGAVVGGGIGATGGAYRDEAEAKVKEERAQASNDQGRNRTASNDTRASQGASGMSRDQIRQAQTALRDQGLYDGQIDGIYGPQTRQAVNQYQERNGMRKTASLDRRTFDNLTQQTAQTPDEQNNLSPAQRDPNLNNQN